jgi:hypothetical protein
MDHKKYWTYIVASRTGTLYIGMTNNLYVRVAQHKAGEIEGFPANIIAIVSSTGRVLTRFSKPLNGKSSLRVGGARRRLH